MSRIINNPAQSKNDFTLNGVEGLATNPKDNQGNPVMAQLQIHVCDLLGTSSGECPASSSQTPNHSDAAGTSGIDWSAATGSESPKIGFKFKRYKTYAALKNRLEGGPVNSGDVETVSLDIAKLLPDSSSIIVPVAKDGVDVSSIPGGFSVSFSSDGAYLLSEMEVTATDKAGNVADIKLAKKPAGSSTTTGSVADDQTPLGVYHFDLLVADVPKDNVKKTARVTFAKVADTGGSCEQSDFEGNGPATGWFRCSVAPSVTVQDHWFGVARKLGKNNDPSNPLWVASGPTSDKHPQLDETHTVYEDTTTIPVLIPKTGNGKSVEGSYELNFSYEPIAGSLSSVNDNAGSKIYLTDTHVTFGIDYTAPKVTLKETQLESKWLQRNSFTMTKGSKVIVTYPTADANHPTQISYNLSEQDLPSDTSSIAANTDLSVSGADQNKFKFTALRYGNYDDAANALSGSPEAKPGKTTSVSAVAGADGTIDVEFNQDGVYLVKDMQVQVCDEAGNHSEIKLDEGGDGIAKSNYGMIVFVGPNNKPTQSMKIHDVKDQSRGAGNLEPASHLQWHRGSVSATLSVTDKWFDVVQQLKSLNKPGDPDNPASVQKLELFTHGIAGGAENDASFGTPLTTNSFSRSTTDPDTWTAEVAMPAAQKGSHAGWSVEGTYALGLNYRSVGGTPATDSDPQASAHQTFGIDYTDPQFKDLRFSQTGPAQWGWVFAAGPGPESFTATTEDEVSGVCNVNDPKCSGESQFAFNGNFQQAGVEHPAYQKTSSDRDGHQTDVSVSFGDDSERLTLKGSTLHISDRAGNVSSLDLGDTVMPSGYVSDKDKPKLLSNLPKGTTGIAIDTKTPTIGVVYDNNNVRNGKYYKANRTATVTINESNFDFIKANDKYRDIVVTQADGSKMTVDADKFANPSKDGSTWVAQVPCDHDADWAFDVSLTDPAGHVAVPFHDEFTIDTQKPVLEMKFDNNSAENGNYYKAVRTASIKQTERNFSPADTAVTVIAKDANGVSVAPPAAAPWSEASKDYERTTSVPFTGELHYSIKVTATDLAGNTAEAVEEPEFIIDMTKPKLAISQVSDKTAYAGKVTPQIDFSDTNFDPMDADYTLTRTRDPDPGKKDQNAKRGKSNTNDVFLQSKEQDSNTSKSVALPDVEHTVDNDDVYTLDAKVKDKAGNESEQKVVFSLNRFGSNYILDGATQNILGRYIKAPQEVHVTEINVSGLNFDKSHTELVHNQDVSQISLGKDYRMVSDQTSGWQEDTYDFPASLFNADGYYRLRLTSVDAAGNLSQNTMNKKNETRNGDAQVNFAVDQHNPTASVDELKSNAVVYAPSRDLVVDAKDDVALKSAELKVDGQTVGQWKGKGTLSPMSWRLDADQHEHVVEVVSTDMAGNRSKTVYSGIVVATSWWAYMMARGLLLPLVFAGIIVVALGVIGVVAAVRRRRSVAYRRNVFRHAK
ncbi:hypothetical protein OZX67_07220 [Bifidobacterium sp. ESL0728]|uniref:hypothetical protein n=1 Tax=Bifidobacterium sp. ESL0728 TaxID=2983220 RepID=UPI0023F6DC31|nr:hypothetical protein [Bifidobacterium sp. ESL0728]WEV58588.1 hypothetical protein OZX67_07220 [Bifidobacterium sp. ESL0728]